MIWYNGLLGVYFTHLIRHSSHVWGMNRRPVQVNAVQFNAEMQMHFAQLDIFGLDSPQTKQKLKDNSSVDLKCLT